MEHFCIYPLAVMDSNCFGQPAALEFLSNEQADTMRCFFEYFKRSNRQWNEASAAFVVRDSLSLVS